MAPNVIIVFDTSFRMLDDGSGKYYDPYSYPVNGNDQVFAPSGALSGGKSYRRVHHNLRFTGSVNPKYQADNLTAVSDAALSKSSYDAFYDRTRSKSRAEASGARSTRTAGRRRRRTAVGRRDGAWSPCAKESPTPPVTPKAAEKKANNVTPVETKTKESEKIPADHRPDQETQEKP